eukprot:1144885-Pelagomonas_calceolata.AAC.5
MPCSTLCCIHVDKAKAPCNAPCCTCGQSQSPLQCLLLFMWTKPKPLAVPLAVHADPLLHMRIRWTYYPDQVMVGRKQEP